MQGGLGQFGQEGFSVVSLGSLSSRSRRMVHPVAREGHSASSGSQRSSPVACQSAVQGPGAVMVREMLCGKIIRQPCKKCPD